ncbi:MAG TPA: GAF domain-containing protein, partial [Anaerolineales bacterium]|nr:GAF domain-containing protein [Anaerolineales bacterium]
LYMGERAAMRQVEQSLVERHMLLEIMRGGIMSANLPEFLALVHHSLKRVIYAQNFFVSLYNKSTGLFEEAYSVDQFDLPAGPHALGKSASAYVFRTGHPHLLSQTQFDELIARGEIELVGTPAPSWLGVPLQTPTETIGVMVIQHYEKANIYSNQDVEFMTSIASQVALMVERKRAEEVLRNSEDRYRTLVENLPIGVYRTTPGEQGTFLMANPAFVRMFGFETEEEVKKVAVNTVYMHPEERKTFSDTLLARGRVTGQELLLRKRDGIPLVSSVTAQVVYSFQGEVMHFDCTVEDITERKKVEEKLKRRGDEFASLYEITRDLAFQWDVSHLLKNIVAQAAGLLKTTGGGIYLYDPTRGDLQVEVSLGAGFPTGVRLALGEGLAGRVAQTLQPLLIDDYQTWPGRARYYDHIPIRAVMGVPMVFGGELIGVLLVEHIGEFNKPFSAEDVQLLSLMAAQAASAVHNARLFEATRYRLAELETVSRISTALRTTQNLEEMLPLLLDETLNTLHTGVGSIVLYDPLKGGLYPVIGRGWFNDLDQSPIRPGEGVVGHVYTFGEVYRMKEFVEDARPRFSARPQIPAGWGGACLPIRTAQDIVGVMFVAVQLPRELSDDEIRLLITVSEIAGNAIHRTRLFEQTQSIVHRLAALHIIDLAITSSFDLRVSLNVLLEQVLSLLKADAAIIFRSNIPLQQLEFVTGRGLFAPPSTKLTLRLGKTWAGQVALDRQPISIADLSQAPASRNSGFPIQEAFRAYHAVPLLAKGQVKGVLEVFHRQPYQPDREWLNFLQTLGGQAAIALDNAELFTGLQRSNMELTLAYEATIEGWSHALDLRDKETEGHTQRVTETTLRLARLLGIPEEELVHIRRGALLHDIGKMGVPDKILLKPGPLTAEEWIIMRRHPDYAYEMLAPIEYLHPALDIPYCHHEKWDGTGYPRGLKEEQIPLAARIFTIVDVWDALRSDRPYRDRRWPEAEVRAYLREQSGIYFDPQIVKVFLEMLENEVISE